MISISNTGDACTLLRYWKASLKTFKCTMLLDSSVNIGELMPDGTVNMWFHLLIRVPFFERISLCIHIGYVLLSIAIHLQLKDTIDDELPQDIHLRVFGAHRRLPVLAYGVINDITHYLFQREKMVFNIRCRFTNRQG